MHQRGFARAIGADQGVDFAFFNFKRNMVRRRECAKAFDEVLNGKQAHAASLLRWALCFLAALSFLAKNAAKPLGARNTTATSSRPMGACQ